MSHLKYFLYVSLILLPNNLKSQQDISFSIKGKLINATKSEKIFLQGNGINAEINLSENKDFYYKGKSPFPQNVFIKTNNSAAWTIWITQGDIEVNLEEYELNGIEGKLLRITSLKGPLETEKNKWFADLAQTNMKKFAWLKKEAKDSMKKYFYPYIEEYLLEHPDTKFSAHLANTFFWDTEMNSYFMSLVNREINAEEAKRVENAVKREQSLQPGQYLQTFEQSTLSNKPFSLQSLSSYRFILIEFWASDCFPCRRDNPVLINIYKKYHDKGLEIVGVSLDDKKSEWTKAVEKDELPWINISDLKGWENQLALKYYIDRIPFNILINQDQKIVAVDLRVHALSEKLEELFGKE